MQLRAHYKGGSSLYTYQSIRSLDTVDRTHSAHHFALDGYFPVEAERVKLPLYNHVWRVPLLLQDEGHLVNPVTLSRRLGIAGVLATGWAGKACEIEYSQLTGFGLPCTHVSAAGDGEVLFNLLSRTLYVVEGPCGRHSPRTHSRGNHHVL